MFIIFLILWWISGSYLFFKYLEKNQKGLKVSDIFFIVLCGLIGPLPFFFNWLDEKDENYIFMFKNNKKDD
jgi:hypothetical protein